MSTRVNIWLLRLSWLIGGLKAALSAKGFQLAWDIICFGNIIRSILTGLTSNSALN